MKKLLLLALAAVAVVGVLVVQGRIPPIAKWGAHAAPSATPTPVAASPTPTPADLPEGTFTLAVSGTDDGCHLGLPPGEVTISGRGPTRQIVAQSLHDVQGTWDGHRLVLSGTAEESHRPTDDCVLDEGDRWIATLDSSGSLSGELLRTRGADEGRDCERIAGVKLPCATRWAIRLTFASSAREPKPAWSAVPEPSAAEETPAPTPKKKKKPR